MYTSCILIFLLVTQTVVCSHIQEDTELTPDSCTNYKCQNNGTCTLADAPADAPYCVCPPWYTGQFCEERIYSRNPCLYYTCENGGTCTSPYDAPLCECPAGFGGDRCELTQKPGRCPVYEPTSQGQCVIRCDNDFNCTGIEKCCSNSCNGRLCTKDIIFDPCDGYCLNGGTCSAPADAPSCLCPSGYTGDRCEVLSEPGHFGFCPPVNQDQLGLCGGVMCTDDDNCTSEEKCCSSNCGGKLCTIVVVSRDPCKNLICENNGTCTFPLDDAVCECPSGYEGEHCETQVKPGRCPYPNSVGVCIITCQNDYNCQDAEKCCSTQCGGTLCNKEIIFDPCDGYCLNGGTCFAPADAPSCLCPSGYTGDRCEVLSEPGHFGFCPPVNQDQFGLCGGVMCTDDDNCTSEEKCCSSNCGGKLCTVAVVSRDPCRNFICENNGTCTFPLDYAVCECPSGYEGEHCETKVKPGRCPYLDPVEVSICEGANCTHDADCPGVQKCCSGCGYKCTDPINSGSCQDINCPSGQICVEKPRKCPLPLMCAQDLIPTCVPEECGKCEYNEDCQETPSGYKCIPDNPTDQCGGCQGDTVCIDTGIRCFTTPCPTFQCVPNNQCGGCPNDTVCIDTGIRCFAPPCPTFQCVRNNECGGCPNNKVCIDTGIRCFAPPCPTFQCVENNECGGCPDDKVCIDTGIRCITTPCPTFQCVPNNECGGCPDGQICKNTGIVCIKAPCPTFQCVPIDECGGCPDGQVCKDTGMRCGTTPCHNFKCVSKTEPQCLLRCQRNYACQLKPDQCSGNLWKKCSPALIPKCVKIQPELGSCPRRNTRLRSRSILCLIERFTYKCQSDNNCPGYNQRCCSSVCGNKLCTIVSRRFVGDTKP